jgi:5,10-methylenetetrahydrofolate reductase
MVKVTEMCNESDGKPVFICDFSPPRGGDPTLLDGANSLDSDFLCVAYSPGKAVRLDPIIAAHVLKQQTGKEVVFTLATRDMNRLAIQNHLLGATLLGLENLVVVGGDPFGGKDLALVKNVSDFTSTKLIKATKSMNEGVDFRGLRLRSPTDFCVGATVDLGREVEGEAQLLYKKVACGADFLITQPVYDIDSLEGLLESYESLAGEKLQIPLFVGLQVLEKDGIIFSDVPEKVRQELEQGRPGTDIAIELLHEFFHRGLKNIYLVSPILRGGRRDYQAAQRVLDATGGL